MEYLSPFFLPPPFSLLPHETLEDAAASASVAVDPGGIDFGSNFARCVDHTILRRRWLHCIFVHPNPENPHAH